MSYEEEDTACAAIGVLAATYTGHIWDIRHIWDLLGRCLHSFLSVSLASDADMARLMLQTAASAALMRIRYEWFKSSSSRVAHAA